MCPGSRYAYRCLMLLRPIALQQPASATHMSKADFVPQKRLLHGFIA